MNNLKLWASTLALALAALSCVLPGSDGVSNGAPTLIPEPLVNLPDTAGEIAFSSERNGQWQIFVMNADGSGETSLTAPFGDYAYPSWSPDGSRLAMRIDFSDDPADACDSGIAVVDVQQQDGRLTGSVPIALTCEFSDAPTWSPEGSQLVYISSGNSGWDFFRHDLASNSASLLAGIPNWARDPKWSPDGTRLLFSADPQNNGMHEIYVMNLDGSGLLQLTHNSYYDGAPNWSPDGSRIVFSSSPEADSDIYTMNADGSALLRLTTAPGDDFDPDWSPDGTRIAFVTDRHEQNDSNYEIYLVNADGSGEMRLTNNQSIDRWPDWRPGSSAVGQGTCASSASFVADVTIPAGTQFATPVSFTKVWRLENAGGCVWTPDAFRLRFVAGDLMGGPVALYVPGAIQPGASVEVGMALAAPDLPGTYTGTWQLWDASGSPVPDSNGNPLTLTVAIEALPAGQTILPAPVYYFAGEDEARQVW
ncbi:MAG: hypothetical protein FJZ96_12935, partial [Chloroflexi bacterium]|nr:hypothetical protein [Chloroflexota bacterium]